MRTVALVVYSLAAALAVCAAGLPDNASDLPLSSLLSLAQDALAQGKSSDALQIYDHCLERDPADFATLYKRATVRLASGHLARAKDAFREVLALREYDLAHLQLAKIHAKLAEYDDAKTEIDHFLRSAKKQRPKGDKDLKDADELRKQVVAAQKDLAVAKKARASKPPQPERCVTASTSALQLSPQSLELRLLRAECSLLAHDFDSAIGDLSRASALSPTLPQHLLVRIALLSAFFTPPPHDRPEISADALLSLKRCLSADPDSKTCAKPLKALKALEKDLARLRNWIDAGNKWMETAVALAGSSTKEGIVPRVREMLELYQKPLVRRAGRAKDDVDEAPLPATGGDDLAKYSPLLRTLQSTLCKAYVHLDSRKASAACAAALELDSEDTWGLVARADELMKKEEWEEAVRVLSAAFEATGRTDRAIHDRLTKAQRLLKQSKSKDYYKILGVARDADAKTIKRAYRKATLKAHPDKEGGSEEKMAQLNEAYEVLSNPELRARFDAGDDPNDPQSGQGGSPFGGGGFGGGGQPIFFQQSGSFGGGGGGGGFQQFFQQQAGGAGGQQFFQQFGGNGGGGAQFRWG
ncbi:hypothetical protein C6P46_003708 [Rhodotorula mucilaginosa]|uniref:J domain-containing protein n=1 Tax=Rhodotorula mucilaginosa TaxID=5537 RepID=A0A9P6W2F5_RHOMI|nr:hypothetical protein C6P46_003708 [Rhodotorula mucilaginosa]